MAVNEPLEPIYVPAAAAEMFRDIIARQLNGSFTFHFLGGNPRTVEFTQKLDLARTHLTPVRREA